MTPQERAEAIRILREEVRMKVAHYEKLPKHDSEVRRAYLDDLADTVEMVVKLERQQDEDG